MLVSIPVVLVAVLTGSQLAAGTPMEKRCTGTIAKAADVTAAKLCTTINISAGLKMPDKTILDLNNLLTGTVVNLKGNINVCGKTPWVDGPCIQISGESVTFNGGGYTIDGNGPSFWDTLGGNGGVDKPKFIRVTTSGTFSNVIIKNSPRHVFSIANKKALVVDNVKIDNSAGNVEVDGDALAHNTDCFDVSSAHGLTIQNSNCDNQDDCIAASLLNSNPIELTDIKFLNNKCNGGHGISIGSVATGSVVSGITITGNTVTNSDNGLRIKTISGATGASVSDITYTGNTVTAASKYGVIIQASTAQDYLNGGPTGIPTNGVAITNIVFASGNKVTVGSKGKKVYVLCGTGTCTGNWNWSGLTASGGVASSITPSTVPITGFKL
ncbi:glycoside hydrolase [Mrakia frigida]|uniref:glycoside hydrolase n=1 Tax=Mrakia frigida TaxID=29902 RepID=UPI003FCC1F26